MQNTIVHYEGTASLEAAATKVKPSGARIKIGLDMHTRLYVAVAQYDHLLPKAARRLGPGEFVPCAALAPPLGSAPGSPPVRVCYQWAGAGRAWRGHSVHVVYEACGFGFSLYRQQCPNK
jgi:hypothetical protein